MDSSHLIFNILFDLVSRRQILPSCLILSNISLKTDVSSPAAGGGFADVWEGDYDGRSVALKVLRDFNNSAGIRTVSGDVFLFIPSSSQSILPNEFAIRSFVVKSSFGDSSSTRTSFRSMGYMTACSLRGSPWFRLGEKTVTL